MMSNGGLLVDTRPLEQRRRDGIVPGALVIDRNDARMATHDPTVRIGSTT